MACGKYVSTEMQSDMQPSIDGPSCDGCHRVFKSKGPLDVHRLTCTEVIEGNKKKNTGSFFPMWQDAKTNQANSTGPDVRETSTEEDKVLPLSQPLSCIMETSENKEKIACQHCFKLYTKKGLPNHQRSCKKKQQAEILQNPQEIPSVVATQAPSSNTTQSQPPMQASITEQNVDTGGWDVHTDAELAQITNSMYEEIVTFRKNLFQVPNGASGKRYIKEQTRLIETWNQQKQPLCNLSLKLAMIMPAVLLQKPCKKSTSKIHTEYLNKRLDRWESGNFDSLMKEVRAIQTRLKLNQSSKLDTPEHLSKIFARHMLQGKVHAALRVLEKSSNLGVKPVTDETMEELRKLHPEAKEAAGSTLIDGEIPYFDPVIFSNIDDESIATAALRTKGAGGPSGMDSDGWRRILVSKHFGKTGKDLRTAIATMTQNLCTQEFQSEVNSLEAYTANRLIPLEKAPTGIRPIGIGEVLRRIIGKAIVALCGGYSVKQTFFC